jgi:hypothetical protein
MRIPQRMQQRRVDQAEDRRGRSDAQRHGQNRNGGKARRLRKHTQRVAQVLHKILEEWKPLLGVIHLADRAQPAELQHRLTPRFHRRHSGAEILRRLQREVFFHFLAQSLIAPPCDEIR